MSELHPYNSSKTSRMKPRIAQRDGRTMRVRSLHCAGAVAAQDLPPSGNASGKWIVAGSQAREMGSYGLNNVIKYEEIDIPICFDTYINIYHYLITIMLHDGFWC